MNKSSLHYLIAILKAYEINTVVASPGTQNSCFNYLVQNDSHFRCFSCLDERSAAYMAIGLADESKKPIVITCTGATASRNYLSALTEAFYRKVPIIALTFIDSNSNKYNLAPQYIDRTVSQNDIKSVSIQIPKINSDADVEECLTYLNVAISTAIYKNEPIHINMPSDLNFEYSTDKLPSVWKTEYLSEDFLIDIDVFNKNKVSIFIGSHPEFTNEEINLISDFATKFGIPVICDHTSHYTGANKILSARLAALQRFKDLPDIIIDLGNVTAEYSYFRVFKQAKIWRISRFGEFKNRNNRPLEKLFICSEKHFFKQMLTFPIKKSDYYSVLNNQVKKIKLPELPFCNAFISSEIAKKLSGNKSLHTSILNSIRNINYFELDSSIVLNCNVGGFGIDGAVSTLVGQSINNPNKMCFGIIGDTAFFYDMNVLGNRHINNNLRILLVNNRRSVEFRLKLHICQQEIGEAADEFIAAANHNKGGAKGWAESCGFKYLKAENKQEFLEQIDDFCNKEYDKPVLFEVFTTTKDEQDGLELMQTYNCNALEEGIIKCYKAIVK